MTGYSRIGELKNLIHTDTKEAVLNLSESTLVVSAESDGDSRNLAIHVY